MAALVLERANVRQRLLDQARSFRGQTIASVVSARLVMIPLMLLGWFGSSFAGSLLVVISISSLFVGTAAQINVINRLIDAFLKLFEHELQDQARLTEAESKPTQR